jgi:hypothetical protein
MSSEMEFPITCFIPRELRVKGRPELRVFPLNVLFAKYKLQNGKTIMGSAKYEPDLASLKQDKNHWSMRYQNAYGGNSSLLIEYDVSRKAYAGEKCVDDEVVGMANGPDWNIFFTQVTAIGLSNGEKCMFEEVPLGSK